MELLDRPREARRDPSPEIREPRAGEKNPLRARSDSRHGLLDDEALKDLLGDDDAGTGKRGIRCPKCRWTPRSGDRWVCMCAHAWNTFDTHGRCPNCDQQWQDTQCLSCHAWSPHEAWYFDEPDEGGA